MPAPKDNTNARKGEANRQMWSQRLPVDVIEAIKERAETLEMSQADYVTALVRQPNNAIAADPQTPAKSARPAGGHSSKAGG